MKASTIVKVVSAVVAVAATGVAIYNEKKAKKVSEEFVNANEDNIDEFAAEATKEKLDEMDEAIKTAENAKSVSVACGIIFSLTCAIPIFIYSFYYMNLGIVTHMAVKNKYITYEELIDFANGAIKEAA